MAKKRRSGGGPRRLRLKRAARLAWAKSWLPTYVGKNIVRGYRNWFGVDIPTAIIELEMLGVRIEPSHKAQLLKTVGHQKQARAEKKRKQEEARAESDLADNSEQDGVFAFIAGYTSGGFPYGVTWSELRRDNPDLYEELAGEPAYARPAASVPPAFDESWIAELPWDPEECNSIGPTEHEQSAVGCLEVARRYYDDVVEFFARGVTPEDILAFRPNEEISERLSQLLLLNRGDELLDIETYELELLGHIEHFVQLVKARAQFNLANINQAPIR